MKGKLEGQMQDRVTTWHRATYKGVRVLTYKGRKIPASGGFKCADLIVLRTARICAQISC